MLLDKLGGYRGLKLHIVTYDEASVESGLSGFLPIILKEITLSPFSAEIPGITYIDSPLLVEERADGTWRISIRDNALD